MSILSSYSATSISSPTEDDAPPPPVSLEADVLDRDRDEVCTESGCREMTCDVLHEILAWMPAKAAIRFSSSLCTWSRSIRSDLRFIENQCTRSCGHDNGFFLQPKFTKRYLGRGEDDCRAIEFKVLPFEMRSAFGIPSESLRYLSKCRVLYSSNGVLLLGKGPRQTCELIVCNPATREWATLPTPKGFEVAEIDYNTARDPVQGTVINPIIECYPRGHDLIDDVKFPYDYTIVLPVLARTTFPPTTFSQNEVIITRYRPDTVRHGLLINSNGIWEDDLWDVSIEERSLSLDKPVAFYSDATKGLVVHYMCDSKMPGNHYDGSGDHTYVDPFIAAFDIREKMLIRQIELPEEAWSIEYEKRVTGGTRDNMWIEKWNEKSIILVRWSKFGCRGSITAWVLDYYGCTEESWRLVMKKSQMGIWDDYDWDWTMAVGVASGRGILIATTPGYYDHKVEFQEVKSRVFLYVVEGENKGEMQLVGGHRFDGYLRFMPYCNTLRPVSIKNVQTCSY